MARSKSGYKRSRSYNQPEGVEIECSDATYKRLINAAHACRCTVGQFAEGALDNYLRQQFVAPIYPEPPQPSTGKKRSFLLSESLFMALEQFAGSEVNAKRLIAGNLLFALRREEARQAAEAAKRERDENLHA